MLYMQVYISWDQNPWSRNVLYDLGSEWDVKKVICIHISWNENLVATVEAFIYIHRFYLKPNKPWQERKIEIEQKHYHSPYMCINGKIKSHGANLEYRNHDEGGEKSLLELKQGSQAQPSFLDLKAHTSPSNLKVLSLILTKPNLHFFAVFKQEGKRGMYRRGREIKTGKVGIKGKVLKPYAPTEKIRNIRDRNQQQTWLGFQKKP